MDVSAESLKEHYCSLPDEELLSIFVSAELSPEARQLLSAEMSCRGLRETDVIEAQQIESFLASERKKAEDGYERRILRSVLLTLIMAVVGAIGYLYSLL